MSLISITTYLSILDLPLPRYLWDIAKSTTRAERLSCAAAIVALLVCVILIVYFSVIAKKTADSVVDVAPHEWFITRNMWLAPPFLDQDYVTEFAPLKLVIVAHTVSSECTLFVNCAAELRTLQSYFAGNLNYDLPYNFLIGNEGRVYEGRGWNRIGAHTFGYNRCTLGLAFIGDYREGSPSYSRVTDLQLLRAKMLLDEGVARGYLVKDYHVVGAKDVQSTLSPGANLYKAIQKWHNYNTSYAGQSCEAIYGINETSTTAQTTSLPTTLKLTAPQEWLITRKMWLAPPFLNQDAVTEFAPLKLVIVAHTVSFECTEFTSCAAELRMLQSYYAKHSGYDIPYNFFIGNDGRVYEGRGWNRIGAHTRGYNNCTLGIGFTGDYREGLPSYSKVTDLQLLRAKMLLDEGVARGYLDNDYHIVGVKDVMNTLSPGANLYEAIKKWDHYAHNTNYSGRSCEDIYKVNQRNQKSSAAAQTAVLPPTFKSLTGNQTLDTYPVPHEWFITRDMWLAPSFLNQDKVTEFAPLKLVIIHHTVSSECTQFTSCAAELRMLQHYYAIQFGFDIPYNFLIGNEGRVYEGRGWNRIGAHTRGYNNCTLGIGFIGDYREGLPSYSKVTDLQLMRAKMLLDEGVARGYLDKDYYVVGAKDIVNTLSPGANLYEAIKKWDHYAHDTNFSGKSCENIHGVILPLTFKNPRDNLT